MLSRFRNVVSNVMGGISAIPESGEAMTGATSREHSPQTAIRFAYNRPEFLQLNVDEIQVSADHVSRPILVPRDISRLPWNTGYAEVINGGKTKLNEDQARCGTYFVPQSAESCSPSPEPMMEAGVYQTQVNGTAGEVESDKTQATQGSPTDPHKSAGTVLQDKGITEKAADSPVGSPPEGSVSPPGSLPLDGAGSEKGAASPIASPTASPKMSPDMSPDLSPECPLPGSITPSDSSSEFDILAADPLPFTYFAVFDGHAGTGAAIMAVNCLHLHIQNQLKKVRDILIAKRYNFDSYLSQQDGVRIGQRDKTHSISADNLVIGALETAFIKMDKQIEEERHQYRITGGCTALVAMFFLGKLYVVNAGDSRAVLSRGEEVIPMSNDFTPVTERQRLQNLGFMHPELLHDEFTHLEFCRRVSRKDIGRKVLYRDAWMTGWSYKTITEQDTRFPLIYGDGKRARVLATIGVTRGFGDHDLKVHDSNIYIKPFLTAVPQVEVYDMTCYNHTENDFLILGTDGLWDVTTNEKAAQIVRDCITQFDANDRSRYTSAAQELVMNARGLLRKGWRTLDNHPASVDDITAIVIPLHRYTHTTPTSSS